MHASKSICFFSHFLSMFFILPVFFFQISLVLCCHSVTHQCTWTRSSIVNNTGKNDSMRMKDKRTGKMRMMSDYYVWGSGNWERGGIRR